MIEIQSVSAAVGNASREFAQAAPQSAGGSTGGAGFKDVLSEVKAGQRSATEPLGDIFGTKLHNELAHIRGRALEGKSVDARELLLYQVKAGEFNVRVELLSKVADSFLSTIKKLQAQP